MLHKVARTLRAWSACEAGSYLFVPAYWTKESHTAVRELLVQEHGFGVLVVNGEELTLYYTDASTGNTTAVEYNKQAPLSGVLAHVKGVAHREGFAALAVTGNLCVERGVTLQVRRGGGRTLAWLLVVLGSHTKCALGHSVGAHLTHAVQGLLHECAWVLCVHSRPPSCA